MLHSSQKSIEVANQNLALLAFATRGVALAESIHSKSEPHGPNGAGIFFVAENAQMAQK